MDVRADFGKRNGCREGRTKRGSCVILVGLVVIIVVVVVGGGGGAQLVSENRS